MSDTADEILNIAHYWRPSPRHHWRHSSTTVNVHEPLGTRIAAVRRMDGTTEYADIPYDWEVWRPPKTTTILPGLPRWPGERP